MRTTRIGVLLGMVLAAAFTPAGPAAAGGSAATPESQYLSGVTPAIIGGSTAHVSDYPYVILGTRQGGPRPQGASCTGSVVAPRKVVIAAHCKFADGEKRFLYGLDNFADPSGGTWLEVVDYKTHPNYNSNNGWQTGWDVAVVTLDRDVPVPSGYQYPRVAGSSDSALTAVGRNIHFVGYGRIALDENTSSILKQTDLPIVDGAGCRSFLPTYNADYMVCSGYQDGRTGICQGDSGGGGLVDGVVVGIASFVKTGCNSYSGFARLTNAMGDWVNGELGGTPGKPVASFTANCSGLTCSFDGSASSGSISAYDWDFGDGQTGTGVRPSHTFAAADTYKVRLTVTDDIGQTAEQTKDIVVSETPSGQPPVANMFVHCNLGNCQFDGQFSRDPDGTVVAYAWSFGDGGSGTGRQVSHVYRAGSYVARLTVTDNSGQTGTTSRNVNCQQFSTFLFCFAQ